MPARRALERTRAMLVSRHAELDVLETHVRPEPRGTVFVLALVAFGRSRRRESRLGGEVRLAEERRVVTRAVQRPGEAALPHARIEIDAVVPRAVRERKLSREYRRARRLAHEVRRDARREAR